MLQAVHELKNALTLKDPVKIDETKDNFLKHARDPYSDWLDKKKGAAITENSIFEKLPRYWENAYHKDMNDLNVK